MGQIENEFGFVGPNEPYLRHLLATARASLGEDALIYTTDPPPNLGKGTLAGDDVYTCAAPAHAIHSPARLPSSAVTLTVCVRARLGS